MLGFLLEINILKEDYQKTFKKLTLFFLLNPVTFNKQSYKKQKVSWTRDQSLFRLQKKFRKILLFVTYYFIDLLNSHLKTYASQFMTS